VSIQDLQQNPQDTSNFYLANIYQVLADPNRSNISNSLPLLPPPFSPPAYAVLVNSLWFLSLVISITCAMLATLLQQWARRYLKATRTRYTLHKRARIRSFFSEGVENSFLPLAVEALPTLIHTSLFLFFAGLAVFLRNVNLTILKVVLSWIGVCVAFYGCITVIPISRRDSPYYTPLTPLALPIIFVIIFLIWLFWICFYVIVVLFCLCFRDHGHEPDSFLKLHLWFSHALRATLMTPEKVALNSPPEIDTRTLMWTFERLDEDHELEHFFSGLSGFRRSKVIKEPLRCLSSSQKLQLLASITRLLDRTFSSEFLLGQAKRLRVDICVNAISLVDTPGSFTGLLRGLVSEDEYGTVQSTETTHFVRQWAVRKGEFSTLAQAIFSIVVARVQVHDDSWFILASSQLGVSEAILRDHTAHGDSLSLAILIYITRQQFSHIQDQLWPSPDISKVLGAASKFNVHDTSPELQHEFCALWNQVVHKAQNDNNWDITHRILKPIRQIYTALHRDTDAAQIRFSISTRSTVGDGILPVDDPTPYPVCNIPGHVHILHGNAALPSVSHSSPAASSLSVPAPLNVDNSRTPIPPLDMLDNSQYSHPTYQTIEGPPIPVASPNTDTAGAIQDVVTSGITSITMSHPTFETTTSALPFPSAPLPVATAFQHNADFLALSSPPNLPLLADKTVLDNILPTGPLLSSHLLITQSSLYCLFSASHLATTSSASPPTAVTFRHSADFLTPSSPPNLLLVSSNSVLDNIIPTGLCCLPISSPLDPTFTVFSQNLVLLPLLPVLLQGRHLHLIFMRPPRMMVHRTVLYARKWTPQNLPRRITQ
jgi:hypothetical protein